MNNPRIRILQFTIQIAFIFVLGRFFYWQIIKSPDLKSKALIQTYKLEKILPERGKIFSSDNYPLALNETSFLLSLYKPNFKISLEEILIKINDIKPSFIEDNKILIDNFKNNPSQKWISFNTQFSKEEMEKLDVAGIQFDRQDNRFYPESDLAKNIIGFLGKNNQGLTIGYGGLEAYYDKQLKGKTGFFWTPKDAVGKTILTKKSWQSDPANGRDIHTSINHSVQYHTEKLLKEGIEKFLADSGSIIILQPNTGSVLAMASIESSKSATKSAFKNIPISNLFEPGSIFKPLVITMALDKNSIQPDYVCTECDHPRTIGKWTISNWNSETHPNSTLQDIIINSDNIGMSYVISRLGLNNFLSYYNKLGLNQKTGIDLQGETKPTLKEYWPEIDLATASFGQGIAVSQIQMVSAFNALANNGYLVKPHIVDYLYENGKVIKPKTKDNIKVFDPASVETIKSILKYSAENGVVSKFKPKDMEVCTKSGTAQVAVNGTYTDSSTIASYIGFSPCNNPKFTMIVTINNPRTSPWGSSTAAPIWFDLASTVSNLL